MFKSGECLTASVTPHVQYSSSVGVLGCKIDTNRVAYWPKPVDCNDICLRLTQGDRTLHLLHADQSGGAFDVSYDAWNFLGFGSSALSDPQVGGGILMDYEFVHASNCEHLLQGDLLPLSASNSMNFLFSCFEKPTSWVSQNFLLYNIQDPTCHFGWDELCHVDPGVSNQPFCPHALGTVDQELNIAVHNIAYGSGSVVSAR
ncbi:uncharacterized protein F5Z01DRAFT_753487 [Emericellopsis atlantica]|uniref:Uncharacterized protein n=1 Tax=Emericellopsis atlantica TaxID=2614577 RepID=A0A9P7ZFC1_9HYPO|nr:uncharacterized protein F5Z01DRAFT_753487 [Emericellopsis atlantica]KAG9250656.1 hypothetical protein F5Z01DRAFT_753487 [Emericellopsis atlantica]